MSQSDADLFLDLLAALTLPAPTRVGDTGQPVATPTDVFRIEMPTGRGPFNSGLPEARTIYDTLVQPTEGWPGRLLLSPDFQGEQMGITEAAFKRAHGHACYGCSSLASVNTWFPAPARAYLEPFGAKIIQYQLPVGAFLLKLDAAGEVVFAKPAAKRIAALPITTAITDTVPYSPPTGIYAEMAKRGER